MKKKILILSLSLVFFISTTGMPIAIHFCKMMKKTDNCEMVNCSARNQHHERNFADLHYDKSSLKCCSVKTVDLTLKDNFLKTNSELKTDFSKAVLKFLLGNIQGSQLNKTFVYLSDPSPPGLISDRLYLNNSSFLI